jgi:hypothetical protein
LTGQQRSDYAKDRSGSPEEGGAMRFRFSSLVTILILTHVLFCSSSSAEEGYSVCDPNPNRAAAKYIGYSDARVAELGTKRIIGVPFFGPLPDDLKSGSLDSIIQHLYLKKKPEAAVIAYATDDSYICAFLFRGGEPNIYRRQAYKVGHMEALAKELAFALDVRSTWDSRVARKIEAIRAPDTPDPAQPNRSISDIARDIVEILLFPNFAIYSLGLNILPLFQ